MDDELSVDATTRIRREPHRQVVDRRVLEELLDEALVAHLAVVRAGQPVVLPFACARDDDFLLLHGSTGAGGLRLGARTPVSVAITHLDALVLARSAFDSSMRYRSAVVHGVPEVLAGAAKERALGVLTDHLFPGRTAELRPSTRKELDATTVLRLPLDRVSVKVAAGMPEMEPGEAWAGVVPMALVAGDPVPAADVPAAVAVPASVGRIRARHAGQSRWR